MEHATLTLSVGADGKLTASLTDWGGNPPYRLAVLVDDLAAAPKESGIEGLRERLRQLAIERAACNERIN